MTWQRYVCVMYVMHLMCNVRDVFNVCNMCNICNVCTTCSVCVCVCMWCVEGALSVKLCLEVLCTSGFVFVCLSSVCDLCEGCDRKALHCRQPRTARLCPRGVCVMCVMCVM